MSALHIPHTPHLRLFRHLIYFGLITVLLFSICGCRQSSPAPSNNELERLRSEAKDAAMRGDFNKSDSLGKELYRKAIEANNELFQAYGLMSQSYYNYSPLQGEHRKKIAQRALETALHTDNDTLISRIYNVLGCYATLQDYDFAMAVHYFSEAKRYALAAGARDFVMAADCNISEIYHSVGDTLGLTYDREIYEFAKETGQYHFMLPAAQHMAEHFMENSGTATQALPYIADIDSLESTYLYHKLMGDYFQAIGDAEGASSHYDKAIADNDSSPGVFLSYATLLFNRSKNEESIAMLDKAKENLNNESTYNTYRTRMFKLYADNYRQIQRYKEGMDYLYSFIALRDSINEYRSNEQVNRFRIRYDLGKKELEVTRTKAELRIRNIIICSVVLLSIIVVVLIIIYYKKRNRLLQVIVDRQKSLIQLRNESTPISPTDSENSADAHVAIQHQNEIDRHSVTSLPDEDEEIGIESNRGGISDAKIAEIWSRIKTEMEINHIYRDPSVSREIFANRVGCNHTWFSQVIKERTGLSYPQFMNSRRVEEAIELLSDPAYSKTHEELWRQLGFLSKATFYNSFKAQLGMSPSEYRRRALTTND